MSKRETKTQKERSTPGRRLLSEIRPYSLFALSFHLPPVARPKDADGNPVDWNDDRAVEEWYRNRNTGELEAQVRSVCSSKYFEFMKSEQTVHSICQAGYILFGYPWIFDDVPTIATFEHDITIYKKIAEKHPGLIREATDILTEKYSDLHLLSEDYLDWNNWLPVKDLGEVDVIFDPNNSLSRSDLQTKTIYYAETVLRAIPRDENLRNGRPRLLGMRWIIQKIAFQWKCCKGIRGFENESEKDVALFYAFVAKLLSAMLKVVPEKYQKQVQKVVKVDDRSIKEVSRQVLFERDVKKRWSGSPEKKIYTFGTNFRLTFNEDGAIVSEFI